MARRLCDIGSWVCDKCQNIMEVTHVGRNENKVYCPECGNTFYVTNDSEYIGEDE